MISDGDLLLEYARTRSEPAFTELVRRHLTLVYSAALRVASGDAALAEDAAQDVFQDLARKASSLARRESLAGWLHTSARFAAAKAVRREGRRRNREHLAFAMQNQNADPEFPWEQVSPILDEAVGELSETDREAVLLRFFAGRSHGDVGAALGINENAARMRVERALEKLRATLARRGFTGTATLLGASLAANAASAPPAGLAAGMAVTTLAGVAGQGVFFTQILTMSTQAKITVAVAAAVVVMAVPIGLQHRENASLRDELAALEGRQSPADAGERLRERERELEVRESAVADAERRLTANSAEFQQHAIESPPVQAAPEELKADLNLETVKAILADSRGRDEVFDENTTLYVRAWVAQDTPSVIAWLNSLPEERKRREHAIEAMMNILVDVRPDIAFEFVNGISENSVRKSRMLDVVRKWAAADPVASTAYIRATNLSDEDRAELLRAMEKVAAN